MGIIMVTLANISKCREHMYVHMPSYKLICTYVRTPAYVHMRL